MFKCQTTTDRKSIECVVVVVAPSQEDAAAATVIIDLQGTNSTISDPLPCYGGLTALVIASEKRPTLPKDYINRDIIMSYDQGKNPLEIEQVAIRPDINPPGHGAVDVSDLLKDTDLHHFMECAIECALNTCDCSDPDKRCPHIRIGGEAPQIQAENILTAPLQPIQDIEDPDTAIKKVMQGLEQVKISFEAKDNHNLAQLTIAHCRS